MLKYGVGAMLFWTKKGALASNPSVDLSIFPLFQRSVASIPWIDDLLKLRRFAKFRIALDF